MNCIIVDDDPMQRQLLETYIEEVDELSLGGSFESATKALKPLQQGDVDLIFLDVEMPNMSGLDLLSTLSRAPQVILVTAHEKYALDAFEFDVVDFIKKPIEFTRFLKAVNKVADKRKESPEQKPANEDYDMFVKDGMQLVKIPTQSILFINALSDYVKIVTKEKEYAILYTMKNISEKLPPSKFMRVHRSFIVRLDKIDRIADHIIEIDKHSIPISKSYREELYERLNMLK